MVEIKRHIADVCVYTGTDSGVMAAVAMRKRGKSVITVEPSPWLGGFAGGGIRVLRDCRYPDEVGGLTRTMMQKDLANIPTAAIFRISFTSAWLDE